MQTVEKQVVYQDAVANKFKEKFGPRKADQSFKASKKPTISPHNNAGQQAMDLPRDIDSFNDRESRSMAQDMLGATISSKDRRQNG